MAIAISLVPPLAVAGLTLQSRASGQCLGALLLFATNVAAILASGIVVMALYRVGRVSGYPALMRPRERARLTASSRLWTPSL